MRLGRVIGNIWATRKEEHLTGLKFLFVQLENPDGTATADPLIAADYLGAGIGDKVMVTCGSAARFAIPNHKVAIDSAIIAIVDSIDVESGDK